MKTQRCVVKRQLDSKTVSGMFRWDEFPTMRDAILAYDPFWSWEALGFGPKLGTWLRERP